MPNSQWRVELPALSTLTFFNYAATSPMLRSAKDAIETIANDNLMPLGEHAEAWLSVLEGVRRQIADILHSTPEAICFTQNTSMGLSIVAQAIDWSAGDVIVYFEDEFPSNRFVWDNIAKRFNLKIHRLTRLPGQSHWEVLQQSNIPSLKLLALSLVSYADGSVADMASIAPWVHAQGAYLAADAIQAVGAIPVDVNHLDCDFLACGGQKWLLGPVGSGFLYIRPSLLPNLHVPMVGWMSTANPTDFSVKKLAFTDSARRFEGGLPNLMAIAGLGASLKTLGQWGWENIFASIKENLEQCRERLSALGFAPLPIAGPSSGILVIECLSPEVASSIHTACQEANIFLTLRGTQIRLSLHAMTNARDLDSLCEVLGKQAPLESIPDNTIPARLSTPSPLPQQQGWALVTGASRGLGAQMAKTLSKKGYSVLLAGQDNAALEAIASCLPGPYELCLVNLADSKAIEQTLLPRCDALSLEILINNAAYGPADLVESTQQGAIDRTFQINTFAPMQITAHCLPGMRARGKGRILNVVTSGARCALPLFSLYSASKGALWAWSESLQREYAGTQVLVTTFMPDHMSSATQQHLGRKALAYYRPLGKASHTTPTAQVAERAISALLAGKPLVIPWPSRLKLALNILYPSFISKRLLKVWIKLPS